MMRKFRLAEPVHLMCWVEKIFSPAHPRLSYGRCLCLSRPLCSMSYLQEDRLGHRSDSNSGCAIRADADFRVDDPVAVLLEFFSARILLCYLGLTLSGRHSKVEPLSGGSRGSISAPHLLRSWYQTAQRQKFGRGKSPSLEKDRRAK